MDPIAERRGRVERGLLPAVRFEGEDNTGTVDERLAHYEVPGLSFALINDGQIEWAAAYGVAEAGTDRAVTTETRFQAASIAKPVVAVAAMRMRDAGLIDLDTNIQSYLADYTIPDGEQTPEGPVTFRNLLSHTAGTTPGGYTGYVRGTPYPTDLQVVSGSPPATSPQVRVVSPPGTAVRYSGGGYTIAELAMQNVTGLPFEQVMQDWLLSVAGMANSTFEQKLPAASQAKVAPGHVADGTVVPGGWHVHPEQAAAGLWSTPSDVARFAIAVHASYSGNGDLLDPASARELLTPVLDDAAIGFIVRGDGDAKAFSHAGGNVGYRAFMVMHVASGDGAVFMSNSDNGMAVGREMLRAASAVYDWPGFKPVSKRRVAVDGDTLATLAGVYDFGDGIRVTIAVDDTTESIAIRFPNGDRYPLIAVGPLNFVHADTGVTVDFDGTDGERRVVVYGDTGVRVGE